MSDSISTNQTALNEFFAECDEISQRVFFSLASLEKDPANQAILDSLYRDVHTLKGSAHLFGFSQLGELAHAVETSLEPVREKKSDLTEQLKTSLLHCLDVIEAMVGAIKSGKASDFSQQLSQLIPTILEASMKASRNTLASKVEPTMSKPIEEMPPLPLAETPASSPEELPMEERKTDTEANMTIRVPVALLDKLMMLMGEMVLVRNQVLQFTDKVDDLAFLYLSQRLDLVTSELQGEVMKTRMQPIGNILSRFQRMVYDLSHGLNKKIELSLSGTETELDKTLLEAVRDPLTHIIRNACDHAIEMPADRTKAGKSPEGHIAVRAFHEGGQVIVEVEDDGRGLHRNKILNKAIEKGLITAEKGSTLPDKEVFELIFAPGFSTAEQVTNISGRGVGMNVVKNNIEKIGGMVDLESTPDRGTTIRLKIPLTLAIVPAMIVRCQDNLYAIPQLKISELVRVEKGTSHESKIEYLQGRPVFRLRGNLLPLVSLSEVFSGVSSKTDFNEAETTNFVVLNADGMMFGLIVDEVLDTADIVIKPLSRFLKSLQIYSGATVLGDGSVALILDVLGLSAKSGVFSQDLSRERSVDESATAEGNARKVGSEYLLVELNSSTQHAIPLHLVHRLEEFKRTAIEVSGDQRVVSYRGKILPIVSLNERLNYPESKTSDLDVISVIVCQRGERLFGLEVNRIIDVQTTQQEIDSSLVDRDGIAGNILESRGIIVVVDVLKIWDQLSAKLGMAAESAHENVEKTVAPPEAVKPTKTPLSSEPAKLRTILYAEDTAFFRKHVGQVLKDAGFEVTFAVDGKDALNALTKEGPDKYSIILSDIEMPNMNGLLLAETVKQRPDCQHIRMVALTSRFSGSDIALGKDSGFDLYLEKLNEEELIKQLQSLLASIATDTNGANPPAKQVGGVRR